MSELLIKKKKYLLSNFPSPPKNRAIYTTICKQVNQILSTVLQMRLKAGKERMTHLKKYSPVELRE